MRLEHLLSGENDYTTSKARFESDPKLLATDVYLDIEKDEAERSNGEA